MRYLEPSAVTMALAWMTAVEQYLGRVRRDGKWRIRWVRVDPTAVVPGIVISVHEADLACDLEGPDLGNHPELDPEGPLPAPIVIGSEVDAPPFRSTGNIEAAALLRAEHETGARRDRWVNPAVDGWGELGRLRRGF